MFDDFIFRAFAAGIGLALITGPLGCFIVWRRLSYFGDTIAHSALLGVVIAYALNFNIIIAVFAVSCFIALSLLYLQRRTKLPDDALQHQAILAYASDMGLLSTSMNPHKLSFAKGNVMSASLDHAMWFHRPFRADEWMLYSTDSPSASNARGFNRGSVYTEKGILVASAVQEGLMRVVKK